MVPPIIIVLQAGGNAAAAGELNRKLAAAEKQLEQSQEDAKRSAAEMERLLQLVQMSQEEQNTKEKQIMELQQYVHLFLTAGCVKSCLTIIF